MSSPQQSQLGLRARLRLIGVPSMTLPLGAGWAYWAPCTFSFQFLSPRTWVCRAITCWRACCAPGALSGPYPWVRWAHASCMGVLSTIPSYPLNRFLFYAWQFESVSGSRGVWRTQRYETHWVGRRRYGDIRGSTGHKGGVEVCYPASLPLVLQGIITTLEAKIIVNSVKRNRVNKSEFFILVT